jgi:hypothetical protein
MEVWMEASKRAGVAVLALGMVLGVFSSTAEALIRVGGDVRWIPVAVETMDEGDEPFRPHRQLESVGVGVRALIGAEQFGIGLKVNFARHTFQLAEHSYSQLDLNAHVRMMVPETRLALFTEAGPAIALDIGGVGYNAAFGLEVDLLGWPLVDLNLGLAAQYASVPVGAGPSTVRAHNGIRAMVFVGLDFSLMQ